MRNAVDFYKKVFGIDHPHVFQEEVWGRVTEKKA